MAEQISLQVGLDFGTSAVKAALSNGMEISIPAVVGGTEGAWDWNQPDYIAVEHDGKMQFVGQAALNQSETKLFPMQDNKVSRQTTQQLLHAIMAAIAHKLGGTCTLDIVSTVPFDANEQEKEDMRQMLDKISSRKINCIINGMNLQPVVRVQDVDIRPEGLCSWLNFVLDDYGKVKRDAWASKRILVGCIGLYHLNLVVVDQLQIIGRPVSRSLPLGLSIAHEAIARDLGGIPVYEVDRMIRKPGSKINTDEAFAKLASLINIEVQNLESRAGGKFDGYYWTGGGSAAIFKWLNQSNKILSESPVMDNAKGALKIATRKWHKVTV